MLLFVIITFLMLKVFKQMWPWVDCPPCSSDFHIMSVYSIAEARSNWRDLVIPHSVHMNAVWSTCLHLNCLTLTQQLSALSSCPISQPSSSAIPPSNPTAARCTSWLSFQSPWQRDQEVARLLWHSWKAATSWLILVFLSACVVVFPFGSDLRYSAPKRLKREKGWTHSPSR